jgi:predicted acetyltransferase
MNNEAEFKDRTNRQKLSEISALIVADNEKAGFVNLIRANRNDNFLFLDMVIVEKFRKKGLGKKVFNIIQGYGFHNLIFAATKIDNIAANKTAEEVCLKVATIEDENIYLVQKDRYEEFIGNDYMSKIVEYYSKEEKGVQLIKKQ